MALPPEKNSPAANKAAAQAAAQQDVFLREVDEALREDELQSFLQRYGKPLLIAIVVAMLGFAGWLYWSHRQTQVHEERAESFVQALDGLQSGDLDAAKEKLAALAAVDASDANASSARLVLGGIALKQGKQADAIKLFRQVADDAKAPQPLRDLANVRAVAADFDAMKPQDVVNKLKPLAAPGNAWFGPAGELVGMAYLKQGRADQAAPLFAAIAKDKGVEAGLRSRARQLAAVLGADAVEDVVDDKGQPLGKKATKVAAAGEGGE